MRFVSNAPARELGKALVVSYHPSTQSVSITSDVAGASVVAQPTEDGSAVTVQEVLADGSNGEALAISIVQPVPAEDKPAA